MLLFTSIMLNRLASTFFISSALLLGACGGTDTTVIPEASLTVSNQSDFALTEIYLTDVGNPSWGRNLLRGDVLLPGEELTLGVLCDTYDALIVDEAGVDCEINNVNLCLNDAVWVIRNNTCPVFGMAKQAREQAAATRATEARP